MAKEEFIPYNNQKHGKYIVELRKGYSKFKEVTAPQLIAFGERHMDNANFCYGWSLLTKPFRMVDEAHKHDFEQFLIFMGGDNTKVDEFDAEIEIGLDNKINLITYACCIHIPGGTMHGPLIVKKVNKPCVFIDIVINPTPSVRPIPKGEERVK
jgi:hypothetical protein